MERQSEKKDTYSEIDKINAKFDSFLERLESSDFKENENPRGDFVDVRTSGKTIRDSLGK